MNETEQPMTELDRLRAENPLTDLEKVLWTEYEAEDGYTTVELTERSRMLALDTSLVQNYIKPDLRHFYSYLDDHITEDDYDNRPLEFVPPLLELIPYGVPAAGLYRMVDTVINPEMDNHTAIVAVLQAYTCCMAGWLTEDQRYGRFKPRLMHDRTIPAIDHWIAAGRLAEQIPEIDADDISVEMGEPS